MVCLGSPLTSIWLAGQQQTGNFQQGQDTKIWIPPLVAPPLLRIPKLSTLLKSRIGRQIIQISSRFGLCSQTLLPLTAFKNAPNPKFVQYLSQRLSLRFPVRTTGTCQKFVKIVRKFLFSNFDNFWTNSPDWNPQKHSLGQILESFAKGFHIGPTKVPTKTPKENNHLK